MKKLRTLGIVSTVILVFVLAVFALLAALKIFKIETNENGKTEIIFTPLENKNPDYIWQTSETEGDITAVIKTEEGKFEIKLGDCAAAEKFIELDNSGAFENAEFSVLAKDMFIQASAEGEGFLAEETGFACINGAVGFVMEDENAYPSFVIITAEELSGNSYAFIKNSGFDEEKTKLYESFGGIPEYEGKILVFGMVTSGFKTVEKIASGENSGYTGGFSAVSPVKINSVEISFPTEENR